jgi:hypothetical protein
MNEFMNDKMCRLMRAFVDACVECAYVQREVMCGTFIIVGDQIHNLFSSIHM